MISSVLKMFMAESSSCHAAPVRQTYFLSHVLFYALLFFYFALSSGELLHAVVGVYKPKIGHMIALILIRWVFFEKRAWRMERQVFYAFAFILGSLILSALFGAAPKRSFGYVGVYFF